MTPTLESLTKKQREAIYALCDPALATLSDEALANRLGISDRSLRRWRENSEFVFALQETRKLPEFRRPMLEAHRDEVDQKLLELCLEGNIRAIQTYYQITGVLNEAKEAKVADFTGIRVVFESRSVLPESEPAPVVDVVCT